MGSLAAIDEVEFERSVEYSLQALWRTRKTGLDPADRHIVRDMLQLENDSDLDPVCIT